MSDVMMGSSGVKPGFRTRPRGWGWGTYMVPYMLVGVLVLVVSMLGLAIRWLFWQIRFGWRIFCEAVEDGVRVGLEPGRMEVGDAEG